MGIVFRQSIKSLLVIMTGAVLGAGIIYLSTQLVPLQELGFTRTMTTVAVVASQVFMLGMNSTLYVFVHRYPPGDGRRTTLITLCLGIPLLMLALASLAYFVFREPIIHIYNPADQPYMRQFFAWIPLFTLFLLYQTILEQYLGSQLRVALSTFMREVVVRLLSIGVIVLFGLKIIDFNGLVAGLVLVYVLPLALLLFISYRTEGFGFSFQPRLFARKEFREIASYAWYHSLLGMSLNLLGYLDALMLAPLDKGGLGSVAVYTTAIFFISLFQVPYKAMTTATMPILNIAFRDDDQPKIRDVFHRSALNILIAAMAMVILIGCNMHNAIKLLKPGYEAVAPLVLILIIGRLVDMATGMNEHMLSLSKYFRFSFYLALFLIALVFTLNRLLIPGMGVFGAAWGTTISLVIFNVAKTIYVYRRLGVQPFSSRSFQVIIAALPALAVGWFLPVLASPFLDTLYRAGISILLYIVALLVLKPAPDLTEYLGSIREKKRLF